MIDHTIEIVQAHGKRVTGWGWQCSCGSGEAPTVTKRSKVLREAQEHFNLMHRS